jgi:acetyl-CoA acetyltransferase
MLEIVRPVTGGAAVVLTNAASQQRCRHRPVRIAGYGEAIAHKSPHYAQDMLRPPMEMAAARAFAMASRRPDEMRSVQLYDCYTISVLLQLEAAGFADFGKGQPFVRERCLSFDGDFPVNTNGGQLGYGQAAFAGGMTHVVEAALQIMGRAGIRQIRDCSTSFVGGNGGIMSEQTALVLEGQ